MSEADLQSTTGGQSESAESQEANQVIQELEKRITDAFLVFDTSDNRQVDVRELGTVMRSVSLNPKDFYGVHSIIHRYDSHTV